jgi:hypothetical protein
MAGRCPRPGCNGSLVQDADGLSCLACGRPAPILPQKDKQQVSSDPDLAACTNDELVTLFRKLQASARRNWQTRVMIIGELASRLEGSARERCKAIAGMVGVSEPYCRQLYKVSQTYDGATLAETKVKPSTVIAAAYSPAPERWLKRAESEKLREVDVWRKTRAEKNGHQEAPDGPSEQTVYARCRTCGNAGWHQLLPAPALVG